MNNDSIAIEAATDGACSGKSGVNATAGTANTGGGGGGGYIDGAAGGSGVIILKIADKYNATFTGSPSVTTITSVSGYNIYKVTAATGGDEITFGVA